MVPVLNRLAVLVFLGLGLAGCNILERTRSSPTPSLVPAPTATIAPTLTETLGDTNCAFVWSSRSLPDVSLALTQAFHESGLTTVEAEASAYGEDCIDSETNQVIRFKAMQTDFYIKVPTEQVDDYQVLGEWIEKIMRVLDGFPPGQVPGPTPGNVDVLFTSGAQSTGLHFQRTTAESLLQEGTRGSELFDALQAP